jgi:hypothetical protein
MDSTVCTYNRKISPEAASARHEPEVRAEKVLSVKRQLYEGTFSVAEKLSVALDRILEELLQPNDSEDEPPE